MSFRDVYWDDAGNTLVAGAQRDVPAYAPPVLHRYDPQTSTLNLTEPPLRRFRLGCARTVAGTAPMHIVSTGDSSGGGYNGTSYDTTKAMPRQMALALATALGVPFIDGVSMANAGSGINERWTVSGGSSGGNSSVTTTGANFLTLDAAGYVEHVSSPGTSADVYYSDLSTNNGLTWSVDGVSQGAIATGGTATWKKLTVANLPYGQHRIRVTWAAGTGYIGAAWGYVPGALGVYFHNLCLGGATANTGTAFYNWSDTTAQGLKASHVGIYNLATGTTTPTLHTIQIGGNDFNTSPGPSAPNNAAIITGVANMKAFFACDVVTIGTYSPTATNPTGWDDLNTRRWTLADTAAAPGHVHFDWHNLVGGRAGIVNAGAMGADGVHALHEVNVLAGRVLGGALIIGDAPDPSNRNNIIPTTGAPQIATPGSWYRIDTTAAAQALGLPSAPTDLSPITVENTGTTLANLITINRGGTDTIEGSTTSQLAPYERGRYEYNPAAGQWFMQRKIVAPTPGTTMGRDGAGRSQVEAPSADKDIANRAWVKSRGYVRPHTAASGNVMMPPTVLSLTAGLQPTGQASFVPIDVGPDDNLTIKALVCQVTTALAGSAGTPLLKGAVYADNGTGAQPLLTAAGLLTQATFVSTATGIKVQALASNLVLPPGRYWLCGFYYQGTASPTTPAQTMCISNAVTLWTLTGTFTVTRYLTVTGLTDLPVGGQAVSVSGGSTGMCVGMQTN